MDSRVTPERAGVRPGYWCTCTSDRTPAARRPRLAQTNAAHAPTQALIWIRVALRTLVSALAPDEAERAYAWLEYGQWEALSRLNRGLPCAFTVAVHDTRIEWTARRVLFLPLADREAIPLPPCVQRFTCTATDPGHVCGGGHG